MLEESTCQAIVLSKNLSKCSEQVWINRDHANLVLNLGCLGQCLMIFCAITALLKHVNMIARDHLLLILGMVIACRKSDISITIFLIQ